MLHLRLPSASIFSILGFLFPKIYFEFTGCSEREALARYLLFLSEYFFLYFQSESFSVSYFMNSGAKLVYRHEKGELMRMRRLENGFEEGNRFCC